MKPERTLLWLLLAAPSPASAQRCNLVQPPPEKAACLAKQATAIDRYYEVLFASLTAGPATWQSVQTGWQKYRDQQCAYPDRGTSYATLHNPALAACDKHLTEQLLGQFQSQLDCEKSNPACDNQ